MPIPVAPVEHVQLFKVKHHKKSGTQTLSEELNMHPNRQFPGLFCGSYALVFACFASCHAFFVSPREGGAGEPSIWVCSPGCVRILSCAGSSYSVGGGGASGTSPLRHKDYMNDL